MSKSIKEVKALITKAAKQNESNSLAALHFSQAALNAAQALSVLADTKLKSPK